MTPAPRSFISRRLGPICREAFSHCVHPAMRCDFFRLCYMFDQGGFYIDADEAYVGGCCDSWFMNNKLKLQPLCYDCVTDSMVDPHVFTRSGADSAGWIFYVNNSPLIAPARHPVVQLALVRATNAIFGAVGRVPDIQSTTGPGNLTASLVRHWVVSANTSVLDRDFTFLTDWEATAVSKWPLSYRADDRNWRIWQSTRRRSSPEM